MIEDQEVIKELKWLVENAVKACSSEMGDGAFAREWERRRNLILTYLKEV